ncbi:MAG: site-specific integrase [Clostridium sp.]|nr:site-specific integrase [Clostridium sp.]
MSVFKNEKTNTWYVMTRYTDLKGERKQKCKRGFATKAEATHWERKFHQQTAADMDMTFEAFVELYKKDIKPRLKESTWLTKENIIDKKLMPYFAKRKISEITPKDVVAWQNEMLAYRNEKHKPYSQTYLKTLHNQLSAIFNHAVRFYDLRCNPAAKAGNMGTEERVEMLFWTREEYLKFAEVMMDKPVSYYAFEMLYWCGLRLGEMLALTPADFDFEKGTVTINKSYQRLHGEDVITTPKTKKSNRTIQIPKFLCDEMQDYLGMIYGLKKKDRIFTITKSYLHHEMNRGSKEAGVKRIRIHDLRHSHISLLIDMGFSAVAIADRVGHESIEITYRYAHLFPSKQTEMANKLNNFREVKLNVS